MVTYTYGIVTQTPAQKRVAKDDGSWEIRYRWDADNIAQETDDLGAVVADYTLQPEAQGDLISQYREMESSFYHYDGRTNTARLTDSAEVVTNEYVLDAWGGIVAETMYGMAADNEFLFMGQKQVQRDGAFGTKNPNYWARARQYDSKAGRFRSEDPIRDDESNLYRYAGNDPVNKTDPTGLAKIDCFYRHKKLSQKRIVKRNVNCPTGLGQSCCEAVTPKSGGIGYRYTGYKLSGAQPDVGRDEALAREEARLYRLVQERLLAQATEEVLSGAILVTRYPAEVLYSDDSVSSLNRANIDSTVLRQICENNDCVAAFPNEPGHFETTPEKIQGVTKAELQSAIDKRYSELIRAYNREHGGALDALQFTIDVVALGAALIPGGQGAALGLELLNAAISAGRGKGTDAGLRVIALGGGYLVGKALQRSIQANNAVKVQEGLDLGQDCAKLDQGGIVVKTEGVSDEFVEELAKRADDSDSLLDNFLKGLDEASCPAESGFSDTPITWTAVRPRGTRQTYEVIQRTDINWKRIRLGGDQRGIGLTNDEAARRFGLAPELDDGNFATLHHVGQDARGPLVEVSTRYHGVGKPGQDILHSQFGRCQPHPTRPIDRRAFDVDTREYWRWRGNNQ